MDNGVSRRVETSVRIVQPPGTRDSFGFVHRRNPQRNKSEFRAALRGYRESILAIDDTCFARAVGEFRSREFRGEDVSRNPRSRKFRALVTVRSRAGVRSPRRYDSTRISAKFPSFRRLRRSPRLNVVTYCDVTCKTRFHYLCVRSVAV